MFVTEHLGTLAIHKIEGSCRPARPRAPGPAMSPPEFMNCRVYCIIQWVSPTIFGVSHAAIDIIDANANAYILTTLVLPQLLCRKLLSNHSNN